MNTWRKNQREEKRETIVLVDFRLSTEAAIFRVY
jgi:hypothetical protein